VGATVPEMGTNVPNMSTPCNASPIATALFGDTRRTLLALLFGHPDQAWHVRQIIRLVGAGHGAVQRELQRLTLAGILVRRVAGQQVYYQVDQNCSIFAELRSLVVKTVGVADVLRAALATLSDRITVAFIYGSVARGDLKSGSDVDVMVVGHVTFADVVLALRPTQDTLGREVNPSVYSVDEFRQRAATGDHFLNSIVNEPMMFLLGGQDDIEAMAGPQVAHPSHDQST